MVAIDGGMHRTRLEEVSLGMVVLGLIFSSMLYGIMLTQTYKYFQRFRRDPPLVKLLVFAVWLLNTVSVFFVAHASWYYLVTTGPRGLSIWSLNVELALSMAMSGISETFLAARVYKLSGRKIWLTGILLMLALLHFGSGEVAAVEFLLLKRFAKFGSVKVPSIIRLSSAAVTDTAIAVSLCYFLQKKRTGFKKDDEVCQLFDLVLDQLGLAYQYLLVPRTWVYTALCFLLSRLYANTFLCSLNSRQILLSSGSDNEKHLPKGARFRPRRSTWSVAGDKSPTQIDVFVVTETITDGPQILTSAKIRNSNTHLKEILENDSNSSAGSTLADSSSGSSAESGTPYR